MTRIVKAVIATLLRKKREKLVDGIEKLAKAAIDGNVITADYYDLLEPSLCWEKNCVCLMDSQVETVERGTNSYHELLVRIKNIAVINRRLLFLEDGCDHRKIKG